MADTDKNVVQIQPEPSSPPQPQPQPQQPQPSSPQPVPVPAQIPPALVDAIARNKAAKRECSCCCGMCSCFDSETRTACRELGSMVINSRFLLVMSIFAVAAAWGSFFFGLAWSNTYYVENYRVPGIHNSTTPTSWNTTRMELDGSVKLHFPMKFSHIWPAVFITIAWFLSCCFPFRNPDEMDTSQNCCGADADESRWLMNWCKNVILGGVVILATTGCCIVLLYVFMMVSFVGYLVSEKPHTIVPTVAVMVQATLLILAIVLLFISRFRGNIEERKAAEAHQF